MKRKEFKKYLDEHWCIDVDPCPTRNAWRQDHECRNFYRVMDRFGVPYSSTYYAFTCVRGEHRGECLIVSLGGDMFGIADVLVESDYPIGGTVFASWTRLAFGDWVAVTNIDYLARQTKKPDRFIAVEEKPVSVGMPSYQVKSYKEFTDRMLEKGYPCDRMLIQTDATGYHGTWF